MANPLQESLNALQDDLVAAIALAIQGAALAGGVGGAGALRTAQVDALTADLVASIIEAVQGGTLADAGSGPQPSPPARATRAVAGPTRQARSTRAATRGRGRPANTGDDVDAIVRYIAAHPGTNGQAARDALGLEKNRWSTCVYRALREKRVRRQGSGRTTRYWSL